MRKRCGKSSQKSQGNSDLYEVVKYAEKLGFQVERNSTISEVTWQAGIPLNKPKKIRLQSRSRAELEMFDLLHELGHHFLRKQWKSYVKRYPTTSAAEFTRGEERHNLTRRVAYKLELIREEYDAWDMGVEIASKLGIKLDKEAYNYHANRNIGSYVKEF